MKKNEIIELEITSVSHEGSGVGRYNGMAVFVPMTAVGDRIEAKVIKVLKKHAYAIINRIITPSKHRIENECPVYRRCGGCSLRHMDYSAELEIKSGWVFENLRRIGGVNAPPLGILPSPAFSRYRNKAQYPVRLIDGKIRAGFFAKHSHTLVPVYDCLLQPEFFRGIVSEVIAFFEENSLSSYDEAANFGLLRHIFIRYAENSGEVMLCLVLNAAKLPHAEAFVNRLRQSYPVIKTILINENHEKTNVIFGSKTSVISGPGFITDKLCGLMVKLSAQSFYQVNRNAAQTLYKTAFEYANLNKSDVLLDLYCGAGTIGLSMAHAVLQVVGVEIVPQAVLDAEQTARQNGITNARFICADSSEAVSRLNAEGVNPDVIIVDPPRKGLDESLPALIAALAPSRLVYISCNSATLARDVARLTALGFSFVKAKAVDMFPRTAHVECVILMTRKIL